MTWTLRQKVNVAILVTFLLIAMIFVFIQLPFQQQNMRSSLKQNEMLLRAMADRDQEPLANEIFEDRKRAMAIRLAQMSKVDGILNIAVYNNAGKLMANEGRNPAAPQLSPEHLPQAPETTLVRQERLAGKGILIFVQAIDVVGERIGFIRFDYSLAEMEGQQRQFYLIFAGLLGSIFIVMLVLLNLILSRIVIKPISSLRDAMLHMKSGDLGSQLQVWSDDEIGDLTTAFNRMSADLAGSYRHIENQNRDLRDSEDKFRLTFNFSPDAVTISKLSDGTYVDISEGFIKATGYTREDTIGKRPSGLNIWHASADLQRFLLGLQEKGFVENLEAQFRRKDGSLVTGLLSARVIPLKGEAHIIAITRDITERKEREKELLKIEKLESLGVLAGGIAHDFNNILTGIMGNISLAKVFLDTSHKSYKPLTEAEKASSRAGELAHQLLTFARGGEPVKKVVSPKDIVKEALSFTLHGSNIKAIIDIPDSIHAVDADEGQISQVFHNLIINASQAMPEGGQITVSAQNETLAGNNSLSLQPGPYIRLTFTDQGCGISADDMQRVFDPYFTTKSTGNGLGLASVHSIINRHGGHISVSSTPGKGTSFTIYLPSLAAEYASIQTGMATEVLGEHRGGAILVMDDEEMIRNIAVSILTHLGYEVTTCATGESAIDLYKTSVEAGSPFMAVIMDLTIPGGLGGKQAAEQILSLYPRACLVVSSGYSNDPIMSNYQEYGFSAAIAKPYNIQGFEKVLGSLRFHS
ncbi:MAG: ATP-binding protein [Desulforhopalus sp.]|nr:ATP-binding protein [Desulforhopalus sp.]